MSRRGLRNQEGAKSPTRGAACRIAIGARPSKSGTGTIVPQGPRGGTLLPRPCGIDGGDRSARHFAGRSPHSPTPGGRRLTGTIGPCPVSIICPHHGKTRWQARRSVIDNHRRNGRQRPTPPLLLPRGMMARLARAVAPPLASSAAPRGRRASKLLSSIGARRRRCTHSDRRRRAAGQCRLAVAIVGVVTLQIAYSAPELAGQSRAGRTQAARPCRSTTPSLRGARSGFVGARGAIGLVGYPPR